MPLVPNASYRPPLPIFRNPHLQTVYPSIFRRVRGVRYERERIATPDDDFLDLDWSGLQARRLAILAHGLEGNATRTYVTGMVKALNRCGWDALAWNFRHCSGEPNRKLRFYHSGDTQDLETVVQHAIRTRRYEELALIGFSLGGNIVLKYVGERGPAIDRKIRAAVALSVPCDLQSGAIRMGNRSNRMYMRRFLRMLHEKIRVKMEQFPGRIDDKDFRTITTFKEFDDRYTAPLHGFEDAEDYWTRASSKPWLSHIAIPTLLVNAKDDPFLAPPCYPYEEAAQSDWFFFETPEHGGHLGFVSFRSNGKYWSETRTLSFLETHR